VTDSTCRLVDEPPWPTLGRAAIRSCGDSADVLRFLPSANRTEIAPDTRPCADWRKTAKRSYPFSGLG
jgi:hypothetical protein